MTWTDEKKMKNEKNVIIWIGVNVVVRFVDDRARATMSGSIGMVPSYKAYEPSRHCCSNFVMLQAFLLLSFTISIIQHHRHQQQ
jgi:hypothetical protein